MQVLNIKVLTKRSGLESCGGARKRTVEALTEEHAGCVLSCEINFVCADQVGVLGRQQQGRRNGEPTLCITQSETTRMYARTMSGSRESLGFSALAERIEKPRGIRRW